MNLQFKANIRPRMQALDAHRLCLRVHRLDCVPILLQLQLIDKPMLLLHVLAPHWNEAYLHLLQDAAFILGAVVAFVPEHTRACWQTEGQLMDWRQVMQRGRQHRKAHRHSLWRTNQVQAPAEELLIFGCTVATVDLPTDFPAAPGTNAATDGNGQTVDDEDLTLRQHLAQGLSEEEQPVSQGMQPAVEARGTERAREIVEGFEHTQSALVMVLEVLGSDDSDGEHLRVRHLGQDMAVVVQAFHRGINDLEDGYNPGGVHW